MIDNGSGDDSVKELSKIKMKNLHFHKELKNTGFTGGVNIGIKWAMKHEFEAVALLNDYSTWGIPSLRAEKLPKKDAPESGLVFGGTGGATLYKTEVFKKIGLFDEDFFAYSEDVDIDWRMQLAGYKVWYEKSAVVLHKHSATSSKIPGFTVRQVFKNLPQVFWKNVPSPMVFWMWPKFALIYTAFIFYQIPKGSLKFALKGF